MPHLIRLHLLRVGHTVVHIPHLLDEPIDNALQHIHPMLEGILIPCSGGNGRPAGRRRESLQNQSELRRLCLYVLHILPTQTPNRLEKGIDDSRIHDVRCANWIVVRAV
jgi:hypothetical protein